MLAFLRTLEDEVVLVVANLSRFPQFAELDLSAYEGMVPLELFGRTPFPPVGSRPYMLTLGPHALLLVRAAAPTGRIAGSAKSPMRRQCSV